MNNDARQAIRGLLWEAQPTEDGFYIIRCETQMSGNIYHVSRQVPKMMLSQALYVEGLIWRYILEMQRAMERRLACDTLQSGEDHAD